MTLSPKLLLSIQKLASNLETNPGGLADGMSPEDFPKDQLAKGTKVESKEHGSERGVATTMDHLVENDEYYDYLEDMEKRMKKDSLKASSRLRLSIAKLQTVLAEKSELLTKYLVWLTEPTLDDRISLGPCLREVEQRIEQKIDSQITLHQDRKQYQKEGEFREYVDRGMALQLDPELLKWTVDVINGYWMFGEVEGYSPGGCRKDIFYYATPKGLKEDYKASEPPIDAIEDFGKETVESRINRSKRVLAINDASDISKIQQWIDKYSVNYHQDKLDGFLASSG